MKHFLTPLPLLLIATMLAVSCSDRKDPLRPVETTPPPPQPQQGVPQEQDVNGAVSPGAQDPIRP